MKNDAVNCRAKSRGKILWNAKTIQEKRRIIVLMYWRGSSYSQRISRELSSMSSIVSESSRMLKRCLQILRKQVCWTWKTKVFWPKKKIRIALKNSEVLSCSWWNLVKRLGCRVWILSDTGRSWILGPCNCERQGSLVGAAHFNITQPRLHLLFQFYHHTVANRQGDSVRVSEEWGLANVELSR